MTPESKGKLLAMALQNFAVQEALTDIDRLTRELADYQQILKDTGRSLQLALADCAGLRQNRRDLEAGNARLREALVIIRTEAEYRARLFDGSPLSLFSTKIHQIAESALQIERPSPSGSNPKL